MRARGLRGVRRGKRLVTTPPAAITDRAPDLVNRNFHAQRPEPAVGGGP